MALSLLIGMGTCLPPAATAQPALSHPLVREVAIDQGYAVWAGEGSDGYQIMLHDLGAGTTTQVSHGPLGDSYAPDIGDGRVAWQSIGPKLSANVFLYDIGARTTTQITQYGEQLPPSLADAGRRSRNLAHLEFYPFLQPAVSGGYVVWQTDYDPNFGEVRLYDIASGLTTTIGPGSRPRTAASGGGGPGGGYVVWQGSSTDPLLGDISLYSIGSGQTTIIGKGSNPDIDSGRVVWNTADGLALYDIATSQTTEIARISGVPGSFIGISGLQVIWMANEGLFLYDIVSTQTSRVARITIDPFDSSADIDQGHVVWISGHSPNNLVMHYDSATGLTTPLTEPYRDISTSLYRPAIVALAAEGVIGGYDDYTFRPSNTVLRAQFAKMVVRALEIPVVQGASSPFTDLGLPSHTDYLYPQDYVAAAWAAGILKGLTPTSFGPYVEIKRAQTATLVVRALDELAPGILETPSTSWKGFLPSDDPTHGANIRKAEYNRLLDGITLAGWDTWGVATRGEVAQVMWNVRGATGSR